MYNPSLHTATNKPIGLTNKPVDARTYYYDTNNFVYRPYISQAEVLAYLIGQQRVGQFSIILNSGGTVLNGVITGGINGEWWFKDGIADGDLILKAVTGGAAWGDISGALADQTDLSLRLNGDEVSIPAGSSRPFVVSAEAYNKSCKLTIELLIDGDFSNATMSREVDDVECWKIFTDSTRNILSEFHIYGYPDDNDDTITQNDLILIIK